MAARTNLKGMPRFGYVAAGLAMMVWGFFYAQPGVWRYTWPIVGGALLIAGVIGYCPIMGMLGFGGKRS